MKSSKDDRAKMDRAVRDILLDATEVELREALSDAGVSFDALAASGRAAVSRSLAGADDASTVRDLHRGLGALLQLLRRRDQLSVDELAGRARVDAAELRGIESDATCDPNPRTIVQLEQYFKLPARTLVILSGAVRVDDGVRAEAVRFAASSKNISALSQEERKLMNQFVKILREHTDK